LHIASWHTDIIDSVLVSSIFALTPVESIPSAIGTVVKFLSSQQRRGSVRSWGWVDRQCYSLVVN